MRVSIEAARSVAVARVSRLRQLAVCLSVAVALGATGESMQARDASSAPSPRHRFADDFALPVATGVIHNVSSCLDDGAIGTLRQVVGIAGDNESVDLSGLPVSCSTITLTMGEIAIEQPSLTLTGPVSRKLTITNSQIGRILHHTGGGELTIQNLTLGNAEVYTPNGIAKGGCILSASNVFLSAVVVSGCTAVAYAGSALGGAIYAVGNLTMFGSRVTGSGAYTYDAGTARGGGIYALDGLTAYSSTIGANFSATAGGYASGGGALVRGGDVKFNSTTIDSNQSGYGAGIDWFSSSKLFRAVDSTISGNIATAYAGAIFAQPAAFSTAQLQIYNSTIAFNEAPHWSGVLAFASVVAYASIIAKNVSPQAFADLYIQGSLDGQNNLIIASNLGLATTLTSDPKLTPLANHGGPTRTHALSPGSPAVDTGVMPPNFPGIFQDQRGLARQVPDGKVDIGAYERQVNDDEIFYGGFD